MRNTGAADLLQVRRVKDEVEAEPLRRPGVTGVGVGYKLVAQPPPASHFSVCEAQARSARSGGDSQKISVGFPQMSSSVTLFCTQVRHVGQNRSTKKGIMETDVSCNVHRNIKTWEKTSRFKKMKLPHRHPRGSRPRKKPSRPLLLMQVLRNHLN